MNGAKSKTKTKTKTKSKGTVLYLIKLFSMIIWINNTETIIHVYWYWTIKYIDSRWQKPGFSLLEWGVTDKQREEDQSRMIP